MQRLTTSADSHAPSPMLGPLAALRAHVAILPMLRAGPYIEYDISPVSGRPARQFTEAGLRFKLTPPLVRPPWHVWAFVGVGYAGTYAPSYRTAGPAGAEPGSSSFIPGVGGGILSMPLGIGASVKLHGAWALFAELAGHAGWLFAGSMYQHPQCLCAATYVGKDSFAAGLSVGVSLEQ